MADMFDCGAHVHRSWKREAAYLTRWLGPYDPAMTREEVDRRLEHDKITADGRAAFWRGWDSIKTGS
ncbi:TPA: hypothetical protein ACK3Q6_004486 [Burkholderia cepacia]